MTLCRPFLLTLSLGLVLSSPARADILSALTACQAERQTLGELPLALRRQGWGDVATPLDFDRATRLAMASLTNVPAVGALTPASPVADWQIVWTEATNWANNQILRFLASAPQYAWLLEDANGNLLYVQAGETVENLSVSCSLAVTAASAATPGFLPELRSNTGEGSVATDSDRIDNRLSRATHIIIELSIRPEEFTAAIGVPTDVVTVFYTNTSYPKEAQ